MRGKGKRRGLIRGKEGCEVLLGVLKGEVKKEGRISRKNPSLFRRGW